MANCVVINNYNYGRFLAACLDSVLAQSHPFDRILVVDDGSTDDSRDIIEGVVQQHPSVEAVLKPNGGQLSCFNEVVDNINEDDWVFLLDSDDLYAPDHLQQFLPYLDESVDFVFGEAAAFNDGDQPITSAARSVVEKIDIPSSSYLTRRTDCYIGRPTSANVLRGSLFRTLLPYPESADWRTAADRVLVVGASIIGARKRYLKGLAFAYRIHGNNHYYGKRGNPENFIRFRQKVERLHRFYCAQQRLDVRVKLADVLIERYALPKAARRQLLIPNLPRILFGHWFPLFKMLLPEKLTGMLRNIHHKLR